ncbi:hypothetical protein FNW02_30060 [Komarekiella sp. 'clone 1']|uniref:Uncharacterized protein n=1 Tax=Komarekiella delphini-convector SJRDD-AB1 TaxID=2593771 RepID=A0AA40VU86_9NOST|nr:hypothetical protein [Komarekiella delphini-convector]MBD6619935.1 hypothetical protein [Komarekiella delphini-convector SJRDD-AB1]
MQKILLTCKQVLRSTFLVFGLIMFISLSSSFIFIQQANATTLEELKLVPPEYKPNSQEKINRAYEYDPGVGVLEEERQEAYEQAVKDGENLNTMEKAYERNVKAENEGKPQESIVDKAKEVIENVTAK